MSSLFFVEIKVIFCKHQRSQLEVDTRCNSAFYIISTSKSYMMELTKINHRSVRKLKKLIYKYLVYIIYFLGIGMTSSGIVLMPFNPIRYSIILTVGLSLFIAGSVFNEVVIDRHNLSPLQSIKLVILSLTLAIGIGMISGGISHFKESPDYVAYLIPLGIIISFTSFTIKNKFELSRREKIVVSTIVLIFAAIVFVALSIAASMMMGMPVGGDIFNGGH